MTVSIICITRNSANYIKQAIECALVQNYPNWELIIVDDGSSDNTKEIVEEFLKRDGRIKLFSHKNNKHKGQKESLKYAARLAQGPWLAFLEEGYLFKKDYLSQKLRIASANPHLDMLISPMKNKKIPRHLRLEDTLKQNYIQSFSNVIVKKHIFETLNFNCVIGDFINWWLFSQVMAQYCTGCLNKVLVETSNPAKFRSYSADIKELNEFKNALFEFIFDPSNYFIPKMLIKLYLASFVPLNLKEKILDKLHKINYMKASFHYFNN